MDVKEATIPAASLATTIRLKINDDTIDEPSVTSEESDSDDSAVRLALSEASVSDDDESDHELEALIDGNSVNTLDNIHDKEEDRIQETAKPISTKPFLTNGLTVPNIHDYALGLAEIEIEHAHVNDTNKNIIKDGWRQIFTEIRHNNKMCQSFVANYQGRMTLTMTQVMSWIEANHHKFHKYPEIHCMMIELRDEFNNEQKTQDNVLINNSNVPKLGQEWRVIPSKTTPANIRATRSEYTNFVVKKLNRLFASNPQARMAMKKADPWLRKCLHNQATFEDMQQDRNAPRRRPGM